jgi:hypothetical protein
MRGVIGNPVYDDAFSKVPWLLCPATEQLPRKVPREKSTPHKDFSLMGPKLQLYGAKLQPYA